ncbi:hypothetical protein [Roseixanthobacter glucoisosaccharinicivorans]|uniref:hypothetical protein n=1 Tax=Roseixanthobacter glucoisosaccharinicivorans TaxID=3119923 RepID=UPI003726B16B
MSDMGELYSALRAERRDRRARFGVNCPRCREKQPKRTPSILLPGQRCKVDGYRDPRPSEADITESTP